jgi:hypothetical protein
MEFVRRIAQRQDGVVTRGQAIAAGVPGHQVDSLCSGGRWRVLAPDVYLVVDGPVARRAVIRATVAALGPGAVVALGTAAELHGMAGLPASDDIHVVLPPAGSAHPGPPSAPIRAAAGGPVFARGVRLHHVELTPGDVHRVAGIPVTSPVRTATDLLLRTPRYQAVAMLDAGLRQGRFTTALLAGMPSMSRGTPAAAAARRYLAEADGRAQSPLETRVRLRAADGGVAPTDLQYVARDTDGAVLAVADLAWPAAGLLAEADGVGPHGSPQAVLEDRRRQNRLAHAGWRVLRFAWADTGRADYIPFVVRSALSCPVPRPPSAMAESWGR